VLKHRSVEQLFMSTRTIVSDRRLVYWPEKRKILEAKYGSTKGWKDANKEWDRRDGNSVKNLCIGFAFHHAVERGWTRSFTLANEGEKSTPVGIHSIQIHSDYREKFATLLLEEVMNLEVDWPAFKRDDNFCGLDMKQRNTIGNEKDDGGGDMGRDFKTLITNLSPGVSRFCLTPDTTMCAFKWWSVFMGCVGLKYKAHVPTKPRAPRKSRAKVHTGPIPSEELPPRVHTDPIPSEELPPPPKRFCCSHCSS
jgi:hypothetical protein